MNFSKLFLPVFIFCLGITATPQGLSNAELVNTFGLMACDNFRGQIDVFLSELRDNPSTEGWVINGGRDSDRVWIAIREDMIRNHLVFRGFDLGRVKFARTTSTSVVTQFWRTQFGESPPVPIEVGNEVTLWSIRRPWRIMVDYGVGDLCPPRNYEKLFSLFLTSNPLARGNIVISDLTLRASRKTQLELHNYLIKQQKIDPKRIRFFLARRTKPVGVQPVVEYWYIP